jgi:arylsulfatase A-like enzyme
VESLEPRFSDDLSRIAVRELGERGMREFLRIYYGMLKLVDDQVGRVLDALEASDRAEDTIVVFTADHGDMIGAHGMVWKSTAAFYEEVVGVPFIIRFPGRISPGRSPVPTDTTDFMPTMLELLGRPVPEHVQGRSLASLLRGDEGAVEGPRYAFCERLKGNALQGRRLKPGHPGSFMVRSENWKYARYRDGEEFLYNLGQDPGETENRIGEPGAQDKSREMRERLEDWLDKTGYPR